MNTYIYHTVNGYIMIDTGYEHSMKNVEKRANKQGIAFSEIKYIFLTHAHDDHAGFLNELLSKCPELKVCQCQSKNVGKRRRNFACF